MTDRERQFAELGFEYAEGIDLARVVIAPHSNREIRRVSRGWECQPWNDNYWRTFADLLDAVRFATPPDHGGVAVPSIFAEERAI